MPEVTIGAVPILKACALGRADLMLAMRRQAARGHLGLTPGRSMHHQYRAHQQRQSEERPARPDWSAHRGRR